MQDKLENLILQYLFSLSDLNYKDEKLIKKIANFSDNIAFHLTLSKYYKKLVLKSFCLEDYNMALINSKKHLIFLFKALEISKFSLTNEEKDNFLGKNKSFLNCLQIQYEFKQALELKIIPKKISFVLGMHRSGTSAITGMLCKEGLLSPPIDLMEATDSNEKGYWESQSLANLNDWLLSEFNLSWDNIYEIPKNWEDYNITQIWREKFLKIIINNFKATKHVVIKDPRLCFLFNGISPVMNNNILDIKIFIPIRNPLEVIRSIKKRDGLNDSYILKLWITNILEVETNSRGKDRLIIDFNDIINKPQEIIQKSRKFLNIKKTNSRNKNSEIFIDSNLRHQVISQREITKSKFNFEKKTLYEIAFKLYELILKSDDNNECKIKEIDKLKNICETMLY